MIADTRQITHSCPSSASYSSSSWRLPSVAGRSSTTLGAIIICSCCAGPLDAIADIDCSKEIVGEILDEDPIVGAHGDDDDVGNAIIAVALKAVELELVSIGVEDAIIDDSIEPDDMIDGASVLRNVIEFGAVISGILAAPENTGSTRPGSSPT